MTSAAELMMMMMMSLLNFIFIFFGIKYEDKIHQNQMNKYLISPTQTELQNDTNFSAYFHQRDFSSECSSVS